MSKGQVMRFLWCLILLAGSACTQFPDVADTNRAAGPIGEPPALLPYPELKAATTTDAVFAKETDDLEARAAALRARAAILRQPTDDIEDLEAMRARLAAR